MTTPSLHPADKFERRLEMIENAIRSIGVIARRSRLKSIRIEYSEERQDITERISSQVTLAETAFRELKDIMEDRKENEE
jgi:hypothetical protein